MSLELKIESARAALGLVKDGMRLGIGTGSTADEFIKLLAGEVKSGLDIIGVPTSIKTKTLCDELGVPLTTLEKMPELDLVIDGADEVDGQFQLIKGGGGALLREKIVAHASKAMAVIADESKLVETLGQFPLPIEVNKFGLASTHHAVREIADSLNLSGDIKLRGGEDTPFETDGGHFILDASFSHIPNASALSTALLNIPGVVEHGLFLGYAKVVFLASPNGVKQLGEL